MVGTALRAFAHPTAPQTRDERMHRYWRFFFDAGFFAGGGSAG
jgi:hypothetical protein